MVTKTELALAQRAVDRVRALVNQCGTDGRGADGGRWGWAICYWAAFFTCCRLDSGAEWAAGRVALWPPGHPRPDPARVRAARAHLMRNGHRPRIDRALGAVTEAHLGAMTALYLDLERADLARLTAAAEAAQRAAAAYRAGGHPDPTDLAAAEAADPVHARIPDTLFCALDLVSVERQVDGLRRFG